MKIIQCAQLSQGWYELHRGRPTASDFDKVLTPANKKPSAQQKKFICKMIAQKFCHEPMWTGDEYVSPDMMRGTVVEPEARHLYNLEAEASVVQVGFCMTDDERFGCSPDGLVGDDGGVEIKCPKLETQAEYIMDEELPLAYKCQVHGCLLVTDRKWWDFFSYSPGLPPFRIRVFPDEFTELLRAELNRFWDKYVAAVERMKTA